ncbi:GNAT family N-acetyltransferase [Candidatus Pantoea multigeneris]|uniref:GNAT family N-acetyltransferase n=1 Tax=Candidatus Pantoea multigeneris TaxID=2608357 RepID=A0ABX0RE61_9GAMM|nr:GNAT family N-acetyltransferase [Pantoea multigeneris]NIF23029.1 GNAT family N-acetyltransferase [Pantoea multigeneris]
MKSKTGKTIKLRMVEVSDYAFIHSLRVAPEKNKFLSAVDDNPELQKAWLQKYKQREQNGEEFYFIIERLDNQEMVGTMRAYDVDPERMSIRCGSWILNDNKTLTSAVESILLTWDFMREHHFKYLIVDARKEHVSALRFIRKISHRYYGEDETNFFYEIDVEKFAESFYQPNQHYVSPELVDGEI